MKTQTKFKETEIGKIPEDWELVKLGDFAKLVRGISYTSEDYCLEDEGMAFINLKCVDRNGGFRKDGLKYYSGVSKPEQLVQAGDLLFANTDLTQNREIIGSPLKVPNLNRKACFSLDLTKLVLDSNVDRDFIYYYLKSPPARNFMINNGNGTTVVHLAVSNVPKMPCPFPPLPEQRAIAKVLSDLDAKIELNRQMNATLEKMAEALFKHWFVDFEFPDEKGRPYKSSGGKMVESELGEIPEGWEIKPIGEVVEVKGGSTPSTVDPTYWENGQIRWCTPKDLSRLSSPVLLETERKITDKGLSVISSGLLPRGTLLLSSRAPIGYLAISEIPITINQGFIAIICGKSVSNYYMLFWIKQNINAIKSKAHGTTFEEINKASFRSIPIVVPEKTILENYDKAIGRIYHQIVENEKESLNLSTIRNMLLPKLMSGKIRVTEVSS